MLVFPEIGFTDEEQVAFTETLGTLATERKGEKLYNVTLDKNVNKQADYLKGSLYWHLDGTMNKVPILASLLSSKVLAERGRGRHRVLQHLCGLRRPVRRGQGGDRGTAGRCTRRGRRCSTTSRKPILEILRG